MEPKYKLKPAAYIMVLLAFIVSVLWMNPTAKAAAEGSISLFPALVIVAWKLLLPQVVVIIIMELFHNVFIKDE